MAFYDEPVGGWPYPWPSEKDGKPLVGFRWGDITTFGPDGMTVKRMPMEPIYDTPLFSGEPCEPSAESPKPVKPWVQMNTKPAWLRGKR